jgi:class 3 adenylate cyclase
MADIDLDTLGLTDLVRLQTRISQTLTRRFERPRALAFTDIVGSTAYFARFGDEAGRSLQQLHHDRLAEAVQAHGGRIVDTAGDGAFTCFPGVEQAVDGLVAFLQAVARANETRPREHQLLLRVGLHHGPVLTDDAVVSGDAVNYAARVAASCEPGEIRLSRAALREAPNLVRVRCRPLPPQVLKGIADAQVLYAFDWRDDARLPALLVVEETGEEFRLPRRDTIAVGRLRQEENGAPANDVVLTLANKTLEQAVSRWHFELRRRPDGYVLRAVSVQPTEVDGVPVEKGADVPVRAGTKVRLSRSVTLVLKGAAGQGVAQDATIAPPLSGG